MLTPSCILLGPWKDEWTDCSLTVDYSHLGLLAFQRPPREYSESGLLAGASPVATAAACLPAKIVLKHSRTTSLLCIVLCDTRLNS